MEEFYTKNKSLIDLTLGIGAVTALFLQVPINTSQFGGQIQALLLLIFICFLSVLIFRVSFFTEEKFDSVKTEYPSIKILKTTIQ
jgi:cyanate permease